MVLLSKGQEKTLLAIRCTLRYPDRNINQFAATIVGGISFVCFAVFTVVHHYLFPSV